jgi:hypothetical protein
MRRVGLYIRQEKGREIYDKNDKGNGNSYFSGFVQHTGHQGKKAFRKKACCSRHIVFDSVAGI